MAINKTEPGTGAGAKLTLVEDVTRPADDHQSLGRGMAEPGGMPTYEIELRDGGFKDRLLQVTPARAQREIDATAEAEAILEGAWKPGLRKGRRARPLIAVVNRVSSERSEECARLTWTLNGVMRS